MLPDDKLRHYHALLLKWQKTINLVSPATVENAWERHFEDSKQLNEYIPTNVKSICDMGSGAGFPALVLAILRPDIHFHLIESDVRKCAFLRDVSRETKCENVTINNERVENIIHDIQVDVLTSRALASMRQLLVYGQPLWSAKPTLQYILPKGKNWQDEVNEAKGKFDFNIEDYPSQTDPQARILIVGNITQK
jgi:16S rRNA (guanine527-N7)-methyltransferase